MTFLQPGHGLFYGLRLRTKQEKRLVSRFFPGLLKRQDGCFRNERPDFRKSRFKGSFRQRKLFDGAGNVHGKADEAASACF